MKTALAAPEPKIVRCRYLRLNDAQCTAEVADPSAEILLCSKHLARALALVRAGMKRTGVTRA
jgi:hypothetical protein